MTQPHDAAQPLSEPTGPPDRPRDGLRDDTISGVRAVAIRGLVAKLVGFATSVVLARLLAPEEFGTLALGLAVVAVGALMADAGLAAGLIRRPAKPTMKELHAVLTLQLMVATAIAAVALAIGFSLPTEAGRVAAVMTLSLPAIALRSPAVALSERELRYRPVVAAEMLETVAFFVGAVVLVLAGLGVWGVALAAVARSVIGTAYLLRRTRFRLGVSLSFGDVRGLIPFGLRYQSVAAVNMLRDQAVNLATLAISGMAVLGYWAVAYRVMSVMFILFGALWRVSYPATAKLLELDAEPAPTIARGMGAIAAVTGLITVPLASTASIAVPLIFGAQWAPVADVIPLAALGLTLAGPVSVAAAGYLYARDRGGVVLRSSILHTIGWLGTALPLLPTLGVAAHGVGWLVASLIEALVLGRALRSGAQVRVAAVMARPVGAAVAAGSAWTLVGMGTAGWLGLFLVGLGSAATYVALHVLVDPTGTRRTVRLILRAVRTRT